MKTKCLIQHQNGGAEERTFHSIGDGVELGIRRTIADGLCECAYHGVVIMIEGINLNEKFAVTFGKIRMVIKVEKLCKVTDINENNKK